ncbi:MAG: hypothetical protein ACYCYG_07500 [Bellilinea sp.]
MTILEKIVSIRHLKIEYGERAAEPHPQDEATRWRFSSAKRTLTLRDREKSNDQRMPLEPGHRLPSPFRKMFGRKTDGNISDKPGIVIRNVVRLFLVYVGRAAILKSDHITRHAQACFFYFIKRDDGDCHGYKRSHGTGESG